MLIIYINCGVSQAVGIWKECLFHDCLNFKVNIRTQ